MIIVMPIFVDSQLDALVSRKRTLARLTAAYVDVPRPEAKR